MIKIPTQFECGGRTINVKTRGPIAEKHTDTWGTFDPAKGEIDLSGEVDDETKSITFLHELFHAILYHYHDGAQYWADETLVESLAQGYAQFLKSSGD